MKFIALIAVVFATSGAMNAADTSASDRPNIVLIISDDQGAGDYGFMGHPAIQTPHLDRLAAQSVVFPRGFVTTSLCCPSLASIITGLDPHQHQITANDPPLIPGVKGDSRGSSSEQTAQWNAAL